MSSDAAQQSRSAAPAAPPAHEHLWATPAPAGLVALAIACFCFFAMLTGRVEPTATPYLAAWLIGGFLVQFVVGLIELRDKNLTGGNVFLFFSAFFMLVGAIKYLIGAYAGEVHGHHIDHRIDGWAWLVLFIALIGWTPAYLKRSPIPLAMIPVVLDPAVAIIFLRDLEVISGPTWNSIAGWLILLGGIFGLYVSSALVLNPAFEREVLPMPGPFLK